MVGARHPRHHILVEAQARDDHHGAWRTWIRENLAKQVRQARLQVAEGRKFGRRPRLRRGNGWRRLAHLRRSPKVFAACARIARLVSTPENQSSIGTQTTRSARDRRPVDWKERIRSRA